MISICMTNGSMYPDVALINGKEVSGIKVEILTEILENDKFTTVSFNKGTKKAILRTSCISSINL